MKHCSIFLLLLLTLTNLPAQSKHDAIWLFGSRRLLPTDLDFGGSMVDFRQEPLEVSYFEINVHLDPTALICSEEGELIFYSQGCKILNAAHEIMENGDSINAGERHEAYCNYSYPSRQGLIALPKPGNPGMYGLFHMLLNDDVPQFTDLLYTEIDGLANDGLGRVDFTDQLVYQDTFSTRLSAVRHANGRDWWIVSSKRTANIYYITYYGPDGPGVTYAQTIGPIWENFNASGPTTFSPDGSIYARVNPDAGLHIFDFDRCSGTLSNPILIDFPDDTLFVTGVAISQNNRFLYVGAVDRLYQFDLVADIIPESRQIVAEYDGFLVFDAPALRTTFAQLMLAPDGKIYGTAPNTSNVLHIIHNPNEPGLACNVEQHGLQLPTLHSFSPPNFPHFRLWDEPGSPCDTLGIDAPVSAYTLPEETSGLKLFPNPSGGRVNIEFDRMSSGSVQLFDATGRLLSEWAVDHSRAYEFSVSSWPAGIYFVHFREDGGRSAWGKLVVQ